MSKYTQTKKLNKNNNNNNYRTNANSLPITKSDNNNNKYNVIINQNSTFNQDNSINIMLDNPFPYFQNYTYNNEIDSNKNQAYPLYIKNQSLNEPKQNKNSEKIIQNDNKNIIINTPNNSKKKKNKKKDDEKSESSTNKIDYRYTKKRPINDLFSSLINMFNEDSDQHLFWFATYDKLMKTKYLLKIFDYYNNKFFESQKKVEYNFKEKTLAIKDFEIYFYKNSNKPFIRYSKGGIIYTKLYLLTLKQICQIFSYLNRIDYKIDYDRLNYLQKKGSFEIINDNSNEIILPYCLIYCLGKYMNINIYGLSHNIDFIISSDEFNFEDNKRFSSYTVINASSKNINNQNNYNYEKNKNINTNKINYKLPNSKKIAKLIKIISINFPEFSIDDIINYLIPENKYINSIAKITEIKNLFFFKKSAQNKIILSSMVRDTVKGISIQTPRSLISSFCPPESMFENNSFKNSDLFLPVNKKYALNIKDDYKFQIVNANDKDNDKNNPFVIYVCDSNQKINFINDTQNNPPINQRNNNEIYNNNFYTKTNEINNNNYLENNISHFQTDVNNGNKDTKNQNHNKIISNVSNNNNNELRKKNMVKPLKKNIQKKKIFVSKKNKKSFDKNITQNIKENKETDITSIISNESKNGLKIQRFSTDMHSKIVKKKLTSLTESKSIKTKNKVKNNISHTNFLKNNLNKSITNNNNNKNNLKNKNKDKNKLSITIDMNMKKNNNNDNKNNNNNNAKLIQRISLNKKITKNHFFNNNSNNINNNY